MVIFDFDGTLVDSMETFADIAATIMEEIYGTPFSIARNQYLETSGLPFFQQLEQIHPNDERNGTAAEQFETKKLIGYFDQKIYSDVKNTLSYLKLKNIKSAISSNNFQHLVSEFVTKSCLDLDYVLGFKKEDFCKGKPHFDYLMDTSGFKEEELLFVGDSIKDGERANQSNVDFIGKTGLFTESDFKSHFPESLVINKLEQLTGIL